MFWKNMFSNILRNYKVVLRSFVFGFWIIKILALIITIARESNVIVFDGINLFDLISG